MDLFFSAKLAWIVLYIGACTYLFGFFFMKGLLDTFKKEIPELIKMLSQTIEGVKNGEKTQRK